MISGSEDLSSESWVKCHNLKQLDREMTHLYILEVTSTGWNRDIYFGNAILKIA
jgi:hypothetical protein